MSEATYIPEYENGQVARLVWCPGLLTCEFCHGLYLPKRNAVNETCGSRQCVAIFNRLMRTCWACSKESKLCLPAIGGLWICQECDNQIERVSARKAGKAIAEYARWLSERKASV